MSTENTPRPGATPPDPADRRAFLRRALLTGAVAAPVAAATFGPAPAQGAYVRGQLRELFQQIRGHENDHVQALRQALGADARPKPTFQKLDRPGFFPFAYLARLLENTGVGAYLGAAPAINDPNLLAAAGSIALIEARHAGALNILGDFPVTSNSVDQDEDQPFEVPLTAAQVAAGAGPFIANLNGGPPLTYSTTPSDANDIAILNFALALEYLEAEFYNINVPKYYK